MNVATVRHTGGCHCGQVRFEVEAPEFLTLSECNCSICAKSGYLHLIVAKNSFRLLAGEENLTSYTFGSRQARHLFCRICGIKSFYFPRSHPDGVSVNARCLDEGTVKGIQINPFDGRHWEDNIHKLV